MSSTDTFAWSIEGLEDLPGVRPEAIDRAMQDFRKNPPSDYQLAERILVLLLAGHVQPAENRLQVNKQIA